MTVKRKPSDLDKIIQGKRMPKARRIHIEAAPRKPAPRKADASEGN